MTSQKELKAAWVEIVMEKFKADPSLYKHLESAAFYESVAMEFGTKVKDMTVERIREAMENSDKTEDKRGLQILTKTFYDSDQKSSDIISERSRTYGNGNLPSINSVVIVPSQKPPQKRKARTPSRSRSPSGQRYRPRTFSNSSRNRSSRSVKKPLLLAGNNFGKFLNLKGLKEPMVVLNIQKASELETSFVDRGHDLNQKFGVGILSLEKSEEMDDAKNAYNFLRNRCEYVKLICERGTNFNSLEPKFFYTTSPHHDFQRMAREIFRVTENLGLMITKNPLK